jgi:hypothetical protein
MIYNAKLNDVNSELGIIGNLSAQYNTLGDSRTKILTRIKNKTERNIGLLGNVLSEINLIGNLESNEKNVLCDFYHTYMVWNGETKQNWMRRMLFNTDTLVPQVENLMTDGNISAMEGNCVTMLICDANQLKTPSMTIL